VRFDELPDTTRVADYAGLIARLDDHHIWKSLRLKVIEQIRNDSIMKYATTGCSSDIPRVNTECYMIATHPNWMPPRPGRRMPSIKKILAYWERLSDNPFEIHPATPACFRCGLEVDQWNWLERAHLVDRWLGGLDNEANLVMLCRLCHRLMPMFEIGQVADALEWVRLYTASAL
jgi:5-methylcytosine-specific restriction endonuclease McrA